MTKIFLTAAILCSLNALSQTADLRYDEEYILDKVLELTNTQLREEVPKPSVYYKSSTPLVQFQDAIEGQWGMRPEMFLNAFAHQHNEIYILDDAEYYRKTGRCMDDSLAHEMVHYIQNKYRGWSLSDPNQEWEAIRVQKKFREIYCR